MNAKQLCTQLRLLGYEGDERWEAAEEIERLLAEVERLKQELRLAQAVLDGAYV